MAWNFRKLQKISGSYFISLPKSWIDSLGLNKESILGIKIQDNGSIVIAPKSNQKEIKDEFILNSHKFISREIVKNLFSGIEKIIIKSDKIITANLKKEIKWVIRDLPNIEIVEEKPQRIVIQNFGFKTIPTNKIIERLLYLLSDIFELIKIDNKNEELKENITQLRRFYFLLVIHIRTFLRTGVYDLKIKDLTPLKALDYRTFSEQIENIAYLLKNLNLSEKTKIFHEKVEAYYNEVMHAFLKKDQQLAYKIWFDKNKLVKEAKELFHKFDNNDKYCIKDLWMIIRHCQRMAALI